MNLVSKLQIRKESVAFSSNNEWTPLPTVSLPTPGANPELAAALLQAQRRRVENIDRAAAGVWAESELETPDPNDPDFHAEWGGEE